MKKRNKKIIASLTILSGLLISTISNCQSINFVKDTVYVVLCQGNLDNGQPISSYVIVKDISVFSQLSKTSDQDSFVCSLFKHSILFEEPAFTILRNSPYYNFENERSKKKFLSRLSKKVARLNAQYIPIKTKRFSNGRDIHLQCAEIVGEFWIIPKKMEALNDYDHSFRVQPSCYEKETIYNIKDIQKSCKLSLEDANLINRLVN